MDSQKLIFLYFYVISDREWIEMPQSDGFSVFCLLFPAYFKSFHSVCPHPPASPRYKHPQRSMSPYSTFDS